MTCKNISNDKTRILLSTGYNDYIYDRIDCKHFNRSINTEIKNEIIYINLINIGKSNFVQEFVLDVYYCVNVNPSTHSLIEVVVQVFKNDQITKKFMLII